MAWAKNATDTLSGASGTQTISLTPYKFNQFLNHVISKSATAAATFQCSGDTGSNYAYRGSQNGGADSTETSQSSIQSSTNNNDDPEFGVGYWCNISGEEKLFIHWYMNGQNVGAANAPTRFEFVAKFTTTSGQASSLDFDSDGLLGTGNYGIGTNITALTGDETETVTLQDGTIFEESDTNKAYIWNASTKTWTQL